jgi:hypothetical protein
LPQRKCEEEKNQNNIQEMMANALDNGMKLFSLFCPDDLQFLKEKQMVSVKKLPKRVEL